MTESEIKREILLELSKNKRIMLWNNPTGSGHFISDIRKDKNSARFVRFGNPGEADLLGVIAPEGFALAIEVKSLKGRLSKKQKAWREAFESHGGIYVVARSVKEALSGIARVFSDRNRPWAWIYPRAYDTQS